MSMSKNKVCHKIRYKETKAGIHHFPIIYVEEIHQDPFHLSFRPPNNLEGAIREFRNLNKNICL